MRKFITSAQGKNFEKICRLGGGVILHCDLINQNPKNDAAKPNYGADMKQRIIPTRKNPKKKAFRIFALLSLSK